jgi:hypothetical protein
MVGPYDRLKPILDIIILDPNSILNTKQLSLMSRVIALNRAKLATIIYNGVFLPIRSDLN